MAAAVVLDWGCAALLLDELEAVGELDDELPQAATNSDAAHTKINLRFTVPAPSLWLDLPKLGLTCGDEHLLHVPMMIRQGRCYQRPRSRPPRALQPFPALTSRQAPGADHRASGAVHQAHAQGMAVMAPGQAG